jgi:hypothetical protein
MFSACTSRRSLEASARGDPRARPASPRACEGHLRSRSCGRVSSPPAILLSDPLLQASISPILAAHRARLQQAVTERAVIAAAALRRRVLGQAAPVNVSDRARRRDRGCHTTLRHSPTPFWLGHRNSLCRRMRSRVRVLCAGCKGFGSGGQRGQRFELVRPELPGACGGVGPHLLWLGGSRDDEIRFPRRSQRRDRELEKAVSVRFAYRSRASTRASRPSSIVRPASRALLRSRRSSPVLPGPSRSPAEVRDVGDVELPAAEGPPRRRRARAGCSGSWRTVAVAFARGRSCRPP